MDLSKIIHIFTISNRQYLAFALVMIRSAAAHTQRPIHFHILHDKSVRQKDIRKMEKLLSPEEKNFRISFREMKEGTDLKTWGKRFPPLVYYRLLIPEYFPECDRCIYLDADTLLQGDIALLFDTDLQGNLIGAVEEKERKEDIRNNIPLFGRFSNMGLRDYAEKITLNTEAPYYNSGVLLMDLAAIRNEGMDRIRKALARADEELLYPDQDLLNLYFGDRIFPLDIRWNTPIRSDLPPDGIVLHYIAKVWHNSSVNADKALYWKQLRKTPYFYSIRAELLLYELEATVNSSWRYPGDNILTASVKLIFQVLAAVYRRITKK